MLVLAQFDFSPAQLYAAVAERYGQAALEPGGLVTDPIDAISLGLALMLGLLGLPHILMRFYTVPDARAARASVLYATGFIGYFYLIIPIVGFGASALVGRELIAKVDAGGNMAAPLVAELLGGTPFLGFIAAVAFATILAVVAGLTLAGASALSHDIFMHVVRKGRATEHEQIRVARIATVVFGVAGRAARHPVQGPERRLHGRPGVRDRLQRELSAAAAVDRLAALQHGRRRRSIVTGAVLSVLLIVLSPTVWVDSFHNPQRDLPAAQSRHRLDDGRVPRRHRRVAPRREPTAEAKFDDEKLRTYLGIGAE